MIRKLYRNGKDYAKVEIIYRGEGYIDLLLLGYEKLMRLRYDKKKGNKYYYQEYVFELR